MASSQNGKMCQVSCSYETGDAPFVDSELLSCLKLLKIDVGNYVILELGQLCKQISVFHEIDIESKKREWIRIKTNQNLNSEILLLSL